MARTRISEFSATAADNTDIDSIDIAEGCAPSGINNAIRELMAQLKDFQTGAAGDPFNGAVNGTLGATTPAAATITNLAYTGTLTGGTGVINIGSGQVYKDASGNVGIGTSSPSLKLSVNGSINCTNNVSNFSGLYFGSYADPTQQFSSIQADGRSTGHILFATNATERLRINSLGNVGIGTSAPNGRFHVSGGLTILETTAAGNAVQIKSDSGGSNQGGQIQLTNTWSGATNPNKYFRVTDTGTLTIVNSDYSIDIVSITNSGLVDAAGGYKKNGVNIVSFAYTDIAVTGLTTSIQEKQITLPSGIFYSDVVSIVPVNGSNDIVVIEGIGLGVWSGIQADNQVLIRIRLGNAVASTTGTIRVYYRV